MSQQVAGDRMVISPVRSEADRYTCPTCSKSFVRKAHMLRHQQQHAEQKPFDCVFCSKSFKRSDVLRAHQFRCKERGDNPVPEGQTKGRKRSSCTSCVRLRARCDQDTPCARCVELDRECVRSCPSDRNGVSGPSSIPRPRCRDAIPIAHLLNEPPGSEFAGRFPIRDGPNYPVDEDGDSNLVDPESPSEVSHWVEEVEHYDPYVGAANSSFDGLDGFVENVETMGFPNTVFRSDGLPVGVPNVPATTDSMAQALEPRAHEIRQALAAIASSHGSNLSEAQYMLELDTAIDFFTGAQVASLVNLYFENYHRHCPILHRPSFQPTMCPMALLMSIIALGGMYAPEQARMQTMRSLLDVIEFYIFSLPGLRDEYPNSISLADAPHEDALQFQFEQFQGAYLIIIAQYFSGNVAGKRRARRQRYTRVLDIARSFNLPTAQHSPFLSIPDTASFKAWIRTESRIRQLNIMHAFDTAMAIFNNVTPRIAFSELDVQLPCDPIYFELSSHAEMVSQATFPKPKMKLLEAFNKLFLPTHELHAAVDKDTWNSWDMMLLVHCLYTYVWQQTFSNPLLRCSPSTLCAPSSVLDPLKLAISNWKIKWDEIRCKLSREQMQMMGFETSADSYWTLTKLIVQRLDSREKDGSGLGSGVSTDDVSVVSEVEGNGMRGGAPGQTNLQIGGMSLKVDNEQMAGMVGTGATSATSAREGIGGGSSGLMNGGGDPVIEFMPIATDCDSQGAHLRKILRRVR